MNKGFIASDVFLGGGANTLTNSGRIAEDVVGGSDSDIFTNTGKIGGVVDLGAGNDSYTGGMFTDVVKDGNGTDVVTLGGGSDTYIATGSSGADGADIIDGGAGIDTYDASSATNALTINLDTVAHTEPGSFLGRSSDARTAQDASGGPSIGTDTITAFENATGGSGQDVLFGSAAANVLQGNAANDDLLGYGGNDTLYGGAGIDRLVGGAGGDVLFGGSEGDTFWFFELSDSGLTAATRDLIMDFTADGVLGDMINLSQMDANSLTGANDAFTFIGTNVLFGGNAGELRAYWSAVGQIIEGDVNGDAKADFSIEIYDATHAITLSALNLNDFVL